MEVEDSAFDKQLNLYFLPDQKDQKHLVGPAGRYHWIAKITTCNNLERSNSFKSELKMSLLLAQPSFSVVVIVVEAAVEAADVVEEVAGQVLEVVFFTVVA